MFSYPIGDGATLGPLEPWHAEQFAVAVDKARDHLAPWIPFAHTVTDVDSARDLLRRLADDHAGDSRHFYGIWRDETLVGGLSDNSTLLDVACGSGGPVIRAAVETGCQVVGVDNHTQGIKTGVRLAAGTAVADRVRFVECDASARLPFDDASFDAVTCIDSIHHFPDRGGVLAEWHRVLRPGGQIRYTDPIMMTGMVNNNEIAIRSSLGFFVFTPAGINERLLTAAGFELIRSDDVTESMATVAENWRRARAEHTEELVKLEGEVTFAGQQRFFQTTSELAAQRRLSRMVFQARAIA